MLILLMNNLNLIKIKKKLFEFFFIIFFNILYFLEIYWLYTICNILINLMYIVINIQYLFVKII